MFYNSIDDLEPSAILDPPFCFVLFHSYSKHIEIKVTVIEKLICVYMVAHEAKISTSCEIPSSAHSHGNDNFSFNQN